MDSDTVIHVELSTANKITYNTIRGSNFAAANRFVTITRLNAILPSRSQILKIYTEGGGATFYVDAVLLSRGLEFVDFVVGSMPDQLYTEAEAFLLDREYAGVSYAISSPTVIPNLHDQVVVTDAEIGSINLRVDEIVRDLIYPIKSKYSVGKRTRTPEEKDNRRGQGGERQNFRLRLSP